MRNSLQYLILILFFFTYNCFSQIIKGTVFSDEGIVVSNATVVLKAGDSTAVLSFAISDAQGKYRISTKGLTSFIMEYKSLSYITKIEHFSDFNLSTNQEYTHDVVLEANLNQLEEVYITSEKRITVKKDTVVFNPDSFKDGTERVVEDLIKNLPGMEIDRDGRISFKGNPVERLLLDGDDLFDDNYTIGTKNIDVDMVDKLETIENYVKNPLLHGIQNTNSVAINLNLKKGKTDLSGTANLGGGIENKADVHLTLLGISKALKSFVVGSYNNLGKEYSPYNYFSGRVASGNKDEENFGLQKIIQDVSFYTDVSDEQGNINNNLFLSGNALLTISDKISGKINVDHKSDEIERTTFSAINFLDENLTDISQSQSIIKKPELVNLKSDFIFKLSDKSNLVSETGFKHDQSFINNEILLNNNLQQSFTDFSENRFFQKLNYTRRLDKNKALLGYITYGKSKLSQSLLITPDYRINDLTDSRQFIVSEKEFLDFSAHFLRGNDNFKIKTGMGYTYDKIGFYSKFTFDTLLYSENNFKYINQFPWIENELFFKVNRWNFSTQIKTMYLFQKINDSFGKKIKQKGSWVVLPKLRISYPFNNMQSLRFTASYNERLINENYLFENQIVTSNIQSVRNDVSLDGLRSIALDVGFYHNDFNKLFQYYLGINYLSNQNSYMSNLGFNEIFNIDLRKLYGVGNDNYSLYAGLDRYARFIKSNVKINTSVGINSYQNTINDLDIRENVSYYNMSSLKVKTGFFGVVNFENYLQYNYTAFQTNDSDWLGFSSLHNSFKTYINPRKHVFFNIDLRYYVPDLSKKQDFMFIDTSITFSSKNQKMEYSLISKNVSAKKNEFTHINYSDYYTGSSSYNLMKPYLLFSMRFRF